MQKRTLGRTGGLEVSALGLGWMGMTFPAVRGWTTRDDYAAAGTAARITVPGARYPEPLEQMTGR